MRIRIYFNRMADAPFLWSYDQGTQDTEVAVTGFALHGVTARHGRDLTVATGDTERPRVWIDVQNVGHVEVMPTGVVHVFARGA